MTGSIKGYNISKISKRKILKGLSCDALNALIDSEALEEQCLKALQTGGKVYGLYKKKELTALYILTNEKIGKSQINQPEINLTKDNIVDFILKGSDKEASSWSDKVEKEDAENEKAVSVYRLTQKYVIPECENVMAEFEKAILLELKEQVLFGEVYGVIWNDKVLVPRRINAGWLGSFSGLGFGIAMGISFGMIFKNVAIGISLGILWAIVFGTSFTTTTINRR